MLYKNKKITAGQFLSLSILIVFTIACVLPVALIIIVSFSSKYSIDNAGYNFFPLQWSLQAYQYVFDYLGDQMYRAYFITIYETVCGTALSIILTSMFGYALSRKTFQLRFFLTKYLLATMLFGGGMMATYLTISTLYQLRNNLLVLIIPGAVSAYTCIIMRTFISTNVPDSLVEAAKIDGASEWFIYFKIVLPIIVPVLAAMGFMGAVGHWNEWQTAFLYIDKPEYAPLQLVLVRIENNLAFMTSQLENLTYEEMQILKKLPNDSARMAILLISLGPVLIIYPFFQKYFIKGITIGAVKG